MREKINKAFQDYGPWLTSAEVAFILSERDNREAVRFVISEMIEEQTVKKIGKGKKSRYGLSTSTAPEDFDENPPCAYPCAFVIEGLHTWLADQAGEGVKMADIAGHLGTDLVIARYVAAAALDQGIMCKTGNKASTRYFVSGTPEAPGGGARYQPLPEGQAIPEPSQHNSIESPAVAAARNKPKLSSSGLKPPKRVKELEKVRKNMIKGLRDLIKQHDKSVLNSELKALIKECLA